jgi:hypothetical protein
MDATAVIRQSTRRVPPGEETPCGLIVV